MNAATAKNTANDRFRAKDIYCNAKAAIREEVEKGNLSVTLTYQEWTHDLTRLRDLLKTESYHCIISASNNVVYLRINWE